MPKYDPLAAAHCGAPGQPRRMTFGAIQQLVGLLPASGRTSSLVGERSNPRASSVVVEDAGRVVTSVALEREVVEFS